MKWIWNRCRRRQEVSLLAAQALGQEERTEVEAHLAACEECRTYYGEIKALTAAWADWKKSLSAIEVTPAARTRWAGAVQEAAAPSAIGRPALKRFWRVVWHALILPHRYAWSGMVALWVVMLPINLQLSEHQVSGGGSRAVSSQEMMQAWLEQNRVLAELVQPAVAVPAPPPNLPHPRSEAEHSWEIL